jgi:hypothetical protein
MFILTTSISIRLLHSLYRRVVVLNLAVIPSARAIQLTSVLLERKLERQCYFGSFRQRTHGDDNKVGFVVNRNMTYLKCDREEFKHQVYILYTLIKIFTSKTTRGTPTTPILQWRNVISGGPRFKIFEGPP